MTDLIVKVKEIQLYGATNATWLAYLRVHRKIKLPEIAKDFMVYESTARNRLERLENSGLIRRHFGYTGARPGMIGVDVLC